MKHFLAWIVLASSALFAQSNPKPASPAAPAPDAYLFSVEEKGQLRDLQYQGDQLEIQNQKLLLQIEQNKAKQRDFLDQMKALAYSVAIKRKIDLTQYELDPAEMKFAKKRAQK